MNNLITILAISTILISLAVISGKSRQIVITGCPDIPSVQCADTPIGRCLLICDQKSDACYSNCDPNNTKCISKCYKGKAQCYKSCLHETFHEVRPSCGC